MRIENLNVFGFDESVRGSKFPMSVDTSKCTSKVTEMTKSLASCDKGEGHDQFLTGVIVQFDLTFTLKAWTEAERYHWLDFVSSQSTMHRIARFDIKKQCNEYVDSRILDILQELVDAYNADPTPEKYLKVLYNIPTGFELTARMTTNYRQLKTIVSQRRTHRLPEWREFCNFMLKELPRFEELCFKEEE